MDETETLTDAILTMWTNGNVDKCHTYRRERNRNVDKWHTYKVDETETSTNVKLTMWMKRKRRQMSNLQCGRN